MEKKLLIIDDHPIVHEGLTQLLSNEPALTVCGHVAKAQQAVAAVRALKPDLVVLDISLQGPNGLDLIKDIRAFFPQLPVLIYSMHDEAVYAERALRAGARGYVMKSHASRLLCEAIHRLLAGEIYLSEAMVKRSVDRFAGGSSRDGRTGRTKAGKGMIETLTDRELQVLHQLGLGKNTRTIGDELHISVKTVETHRAHLKEKLQLADSQALVQFAVEWAHHRDGQHAGDAPPTGQGESAATARS